VTCSRCEAQGVVLARLARELAEARIALARVRDLAESDDAAARRAIYAIAAAALPIEGVRND